MKFIKTFAVPLLMVVIGGVLLRSAYVEVRNRAIDQLNNQQMVIAETAARGIESFFGHYAELLTQLSKMKELTSLDEQGRRLIQILYLTHASEIKGVSRVDATGRIIYTFPETPGAIGTDLSSQEHIQRIMQTHKPVVSDVFDSVQGFVSIAFHIPIFEDEVFQGSLGILIPFDQLSRKYLEPIKIGKDGYAWIISRKGVELYCPVPGHTGKSVFENCKDFPTILSMAGEMVKGERGTTTYYFDRVRGETVESLRKQATYVPVHLPDTFWSIVVATPEDELLEILQGFRDRWLLIIGLLMLITIVWTFYVLRAFKILKEEERRKQAEAALKASEEKYRELVENANSIILRRDTSGKVTFFNDFAQRFFGYSEAEILGNNVVGTIVPEVESTGRDLRAMIEDIGVNPDRYVNNINENIRRNGERVWIAWTNKPIRDDNGRAVEVLCIGNDITERKRAEAKLRESEERYRAIFENTGTATVILDEDTTISLANSEFVNLTGYTREEIEGRKSWKEFVVKEDLEWMIMQHRLRRVDGGKALKSYNFRLVDKDGQIKDIQLTIDMIPATNNSVASLLDITERKRAEDALLATSTELQLIFKNMINAFIVYESVFDENGKYVSFRFGRFNEAYARIAKLKYEEVRGKDVFEVWPATEQSWVEVYGTVAVSGIPRTFDMYHEPTKGWYHCIAYRPSDSPSQICVIFSDITKRKQEEEERRKLEERLYRAEKMEALGTMAGGVAHDLNNVLGIVVGYSELLLDKVEDESLSLKSHVKEILKGGERAAAIVQDLLTLTRRGVTSKQVVNLNSIIMDCQESPEFAKLLSYHPITKIEADLEADLLNISGSSVHLGKTLMNLVANAVEAMPNGGLITIKTRSQYLDKPVSGYDEVKEGDYVVLTVSDTGEGIPAADMKRIFEPFYTKKVMGRSGTGLGLAVVWGTVKDHLGYINVESEENKGTTFSLYFPVTREEVTPEQVSVSASEYIGNGESILVVDDVKEQRELATMMLTKLNYSVVSVPRGEEAVKYMEEHSSDLIVLDMIMDPGMDGLETYRRILEIHPEQKAIIVSGFAENERVTKARALGAGTYVKKPYVLEKLGLAVRKELDRPA